ncbi:hypothetical protein [Ornithobacterium rhinotracheale]|uniref:hypothetical protein n=1 Tax=Ornithobacterium rhinotracheale TaxID=28251 RepID=UPI001FF63408|nr:hypothetical protein [Ornithobacterium rhinotracheale]MCK0205357.1 hypothetical protein [Ornithobacterium rhinotracheale]
MRKIIILAFGCMLFSSCVDGELSLNEVQPKLRNEEFEPYHRKIDTTDSEDEKKEKEKKKDKGNKDGEKVIETDETKSINP